VTDPMLIFGQTILSWIAIVGTAVIRVFLVPWEGGWKALFSMAAAIFCGYMLPAPILSILNADQNTYHVLATILCTLTGENLGRALLNVVGTPASLLEFFKILRGGGGSK